MRIQELDLVAYGPFEALRLDLGSDPGALQMVLGSNEAGKSTTLRAITDLLFGVPVQSADTHTFGSKDLRIGARLCNERGDVLEVRRRKGRKGTLLSTSELPLEERCLQAYLGGVNRALFLNMFGLDHERLRAGAHAMLEGGGDVGESLFSAGSGMSGVGTLLESLSAEADQLFTARGRGAKRINQGIAELKTARRKLDYEATSARAFIAQRDALKEHIAVRAELRAQRECLTTEQSRLHRVLNVVPLLGRRRALLERLQQLGDVPRLPASATDMREQATRALETSAREAARADEDCARLRERLASLKVPDGWSGLDRRTVEEIRDQLGRHAAAQKDLPKRLGELRAVETQIAGRLERLTPGREGTSAVRLRIGVAASARIRALAGSRGERVSNARHAERELGALAARRAHYSRALEQLPEKVDLGAARCVLATARKATDLDDQAAELARCERDLRTQADNQLLRLGLWTGPLDTLVRLAPPLDETVERFDAEFKQAEVGLAQLESERAAAAERQAAAAHGIEELTRQGDVPTEAQLDRARRERDDALSALDATDARALSTLRERVQLADSVADRLRREADRVARLASLEAERAAAARSRQDAEAQARQARTTLVPLREEWRRLWQEPLGIEPRSPSEMGHWLKRHRELLATARELDSAERRGTELQRRLEGDRATVLQWLAEVGMPSTDADWPRLLATMEDRVRDAEEAESRRRELSELVTDLDAQLAAARDELQRCTVSLEQWSRQWADAVQPLGLDPAATPDEALAVLEEGAQLLRQVDEAARLRRRVEGMERDSERFGVEVAALYARHLPDGAARSTTEAAQALLEWHDTVSRAAEQKLVLDSELAEREASLEGFRDAEASARQRLQALMADARAHDLDALREVEHRSRQAQTYREQLDEVESDLAAAGDGASIAELLEQTRGVDIDPLRARLEQIGVELEELGERLADVASQIATTEQGVRRLGESQAPEAASEVQGHASEIRKNVRQYLRVRLAAILLEQEIEQYRRKNQGPLLSRASELFSQLTLGRYEELKAGVDANDRAVLECVRADGPVVGVEGLSDGTCDQLYLALRLASLERHAEFNEPLPVILDDVLIHFDDTRASAALRVLGELSKRCQVLFFTHHARLVELAERALPPHQLNVTRLALAATARRMDASLEISARVDRNLS